MKNQTVPLVRFNNRAAAERAVHMLEAEGMNPSLAFGQSPGIPSDDSENGDHDWIVLEAPSEEAQAAALLIDTMLEELEAEEEDELVIGQQ